MTKKRKITISDVAREMRVSVTTVSFVLNGKAEGRVSPSVIRRITDYANRVGYRPNPRSKTRRDVAKLYAVLVEDISNSWQSQLVFHLEEQLKNNGGHLVVMSMNRDFAQAQGMLERLIGMELGGYVVMPFEGLEQVWRHQLKGKAPLVVLDGADNSEGMLNVRLDYRSCLKDTLSKYMGRNPAHRLGLVTCPSNTHKASEFLHGYMQAMDERNSDVLVKKVQLGSDDGAMREQISDFLRDNRLDGVVLSTDRLARLASEVVREEDLAVHCVVSTADNLSFGGRETEQLVLPLNASVVAKEIVRSLVSSPE